MDPKSKENRIELRRLAYFFKHFRPDQKKFMATSVDDFLAESPKTAPRSKSLSKMLDFMTQKVFKPMGRFGRPVPTNKQSPQVLKRRRKKMEPSFMLLHTSSERIQRRYRGYLEPSRRRRIPKKTSQKVSQIENDR